MRLLLKNTKLLQTKEQLQTCDVLIENNRIIAIKTDVESTTADQIIDCRGNLLVPGFIDVHVHLREPGGEHKETIETGTKAAARGGFTTICAMPNTNPVPDSIDRVENLHEKITADAKVRVLPYASITTGLQGETLSPITELAKQNVFAFTDDGVGIQTADQMLSAMRLAAKAGKAIVAHCEDNSLLHGGVVHQGLASERLNLPGISSVTEAVQIARDVLLAEAANCRYHVCHVSTKESVRVIRDAKRAGIKVTAEVTPHHLLLNEEDIKDADANFKMNPPLRSEADQEALLEGLLDGTIDMIATDHAPHATEEKALGFLKAPFGIVGLETAFPLLYTNLVKTKKVSLRQLIDWLTIKPAEAFQLPYGTMEIGKLADLTLIDLNSSEKIDKQKFYSKGKNTPFEGWKVFGIPKLTVMEGKIVYNNL
ncbi:dihydroorotase [Virgibacillus sp. 179-BFC.A HS]|uniref:Dihydroorotase n=1 Tax=Tigheibacillus jepli TaxID=3035914 RepID=A0ABU5CHZ5_9BACI|nr:dihydroorotase [Virgibacillus sp. 179-BFC.A HS]MDY0405948.1 dihydroorotase [Virgibacillus sp. 179-BFC.A HS]